MPQELLYQERSIAEIGRINPDLWDFGRLPPPLLYRMRFRGFPPCPLLFPLPLSSDSANQRRSAKFRRDLPRVGRTSLFSARSDRPIVIGRSRGSPLGTIIPFPSSEDCDLRNAKSQFTGRSTRPQFAGRNTPLQFAGRKSQVSQKYRKVAVR